MIDNLVVYKGGQVFAMLTGTPELLDMNLKAMRPCQYLQVAAKPARIAVCPAYDTIEGSLIDVPVATAGLEADPVYPPA